MRRLWVNNNFTEMVQWEKLFDHSGMGHANNDDRVSLKLLEDTKFNLSVEEYSITFYSWKEG